MKAVVSVTFDDIFVHDVIVGVKMGFVAMPSKP